MCVFFVDVWLCFDLVLGLSVVFFSFRVECGVFRRRVGFFGESFSCAFFVVVYFLGDRDAYPLCLFFLFCIGCFFRCRPRLVCVVVSVLLRVSCSLMDVLCLCLGWMCVCVCLVLSVV